MYGHVVHKRDFINGLGGLLGSGGGSVSNNISPSPSPTPTPSHSSTPPLSSQLGGLSSVLGSVGSQVGSLLPSVPPVSDPSRSSILSSSSSPTVSTSPRASSATSISSPSSSLTSSSASPSLSPLSSSSLSTSSPPPSSPTPFPSPPDSATSFSLNGQTVIVTSSVNPAPSESAAASSPKSFLENKALSGGVFAAIGVVVVIIAVIIITTCVRKRSRNRLHGDAAILSFDPRDVEERISNEKLRSSGSHSSHSHTHNDQASLAGAVAPISNGAQVRRDYSNSRSIGKPVYNRMPNPYATYANSTYRGPRPPSPIYGVGTAGNGYTINNAAADFAPHAKLYLNQSGAPTLAPATRDTSTARIPPRAPLPDTFGDDDIYGGVTSLDRLEQIAGTTNFPRSLHVANE